MRKSFLSAWLCTGVVASAICGTHKLPADEPIAAIDFPNEWQTKELGEGFESTSRDGAVRFLVFPVEVHKVAESMGEAMSYLRNTGAIVVQSESIKREQGKLNDMSVTNVSWQGKDKKGDVHIRFTIFSLAKGKSLLVAYCSPPNAEKQHQRELEKILHSIKQV